MLVPLRRVPVTMTMLGYSFRDEEKVRDSGDGADHDLMGNHQHQLAGFNLLHPVAQHRQCGLTVHMSVKKGIQPGKRHSRANIHLGDGVAAPAPFAGKNDIRLDVMAAKIGANGTRLCPPLIIKVALRYAVFDPEMRRVAKARCQRVPHKQNIGVNGVDGIADRFSQHIASTQQKQQK
mgnify:CR=1 FL=1